MIDKVKKSALSSTFTVKEKDLITPHYIRIIFDMTEEQVALFRNVKIGAHNKLFIPTTGPGSTVARTYTTRHIDYSKKELWVDFVAHGDNGPASFWANRATRGSLLSIGMKESNKPLFPAADEYLFAGDSTALPVIAAMLEQLPEHVSVKVILEVYGKEDEIGLYSKANMSIEWVYNPTPEKESPLAETIRNTILPGSKGFVFVAAEYETVKNLKRYFREELILPPESYSVVSYWKRGSSEDQSSLERQQQRHS
jgi:NADPH-dependent ferric siderophore reductase